MNAKRQTKVIKIMTFFLFKKINKRTKSPSTINVKDKVETEVRHTLLDPLLYICTFEMIFDPSSPTELEQEPPLTPSFISYH